MKKVTAEIIETTRFKATVEVKDDATEKDIYNEIDLAYIDDDCELIEETFYEITNIKVCEK